MTPLKNVAIVGVGLIGGSIGLALRQRQLAETVVGIGRRQSSLRVARQLGAVTTTTTSLAKGVAEADFVIVCTPVGQIVDHIVEAAGNCPEGTLITDAGSTKAQIVAALDGRLSRGCRYLGSHPLAGSEKTGPAHADGALFDGRIALITPTKNTLAEDYDFIERFWQALGAVVIRMSPEEHDQALAVTSHLPHVVAAALASAVPERLFRLAGSGMLDTTRIAGGDPSLWTQIFSHNRQNLLTALAAFADRLDALRGAIGEDRQADVERLLLSAKKNRDALGS